MSKIVNFFSLKGEKLLKVTENGGDVEIVTSGGTYRISHEQQCCESVGLYRTEMCQKSFGEEITEASEEFLNEHPEFFKDETYFESFTWSVYRIHTKSGISTIYFLGKSNGYYGETTEVIKIA